MSKSAKKLEKAYGAEVDAVWQEMRLKEDAAFRDHVRHLIAEARGREIEGLVDDVQATDIALFEERYRHTRLKHRYAELESSFVWATMSVIIILCAACAYMIGR